MLLQTTPSSSVACTLVLNNRKKFHNHGLLEMVLETIWRTETPTETHLLNDTTP